MNERYCPKHNYIYPEGGVCVVCKWEELSVSREALTIRDNPELRMGLAIAACKAIVALCEARPLGWIELIKELTTMLRCVNNPSLIAEPK